MNWSARQEVVKFKYMASNELKLAIRLAKEAGNELMRNFNKSVVIKFKGDKRNVVTDMDLQIENLIVKKLRKAYPNHQIYGEEEGFQGEKSDYIWFVDSIDGSKYYIAGSNLFSISISLWRKNNPIVGVVYFPASKDLYWAEKDKGSFHNKKRIKVSYREELKESIIYLDQGNFNKLNKNNKIKFIKRLKAINEKFYRFRNIGCSSLGLCLLAEGSLEAYFGLSGKEKIYDVAAGIVIGMEAGAKFTNLDGQFKGQNVSHLVVTNGKIHQKLLKLLNS